MQGEFVVNIPKLREQSDQFAAEARIAERLSSTLKRVRRTAEPEKRAYYAKLIKRVDDLAKFYHQMSRAADSTANDVTHLLRSVMSELDENALNNARRFSLNE